MSTKVQGGLCGQGPPSLILLPSHYASAYQLSFLPIYATFTVTELPTDVTDQDEVSWSIEELHVDVNQCRPQDLPYKSMMIE
ncbi:hypothetical protein KIN20_024788 [Parelaphostrongylus tenuis]|uniref:Uncharacterized protein n=1 Tax=Parelaphostrongylus tenuis TaxID=148309 RepID=A0AAD5N7Z2_PARTN|nr:hypothetical protein KIN20_024788 [Parelaphostrongylus tenuis]